MTEELTVLPFDPAADEAQTRRALDTVTTQFVTFDDHANDSASKFDKSLAHARTLAADWGLETWSIALPLLSGRHEHATLAAWHSWLAAQHLDQLTTRSADIDGYLAQIGHRSPLATLHGLDLEGSGTMLRFVGNCRRGAMDGSEPLDQQPVLLLLGSDQTPVLRIPTRPARRFDQGVHSWTGFTADVAISDLPVGQLRLAIELPAPSGREPLQRRVHATVGMLVSSRRIASSGRQLQVVQAANGYLMDLLVARGGSWANRATWTARMIRRDLGAWLHRRPFGGTRVLRLLTRPFTPRHIWLLGERSDTARDNGYHLFSYLRRERRDIRAYYVIERDCEQRDRVSGFGRVITHSSWRHRLLMLHAEVIVGAYSIKHLVPQQWDPGLYSRQLAWRTGAYRVYLKHGVNVNTRVLKRRVSGYDLYLTAVAAETVAARATSGYDRQIEETGLTRYDALLPTPPSRTVLFMPTWRQYLVPKLFGEDSSAQVEFAGSVYRKFMLDLLGSTRLSHVLESHDFRLDFMPHYNLREHLSDLPVHSERVAVLDGGSADIQEIMRSCDVFITDHSSVHFDLAYLGTPVVYAHFDVDDYRSGHAEESWFDHERDGFGPVAYDVESTIDALESYLQNDCHREDIYTERARQSFTFHDRDNCHRTVAAIEKLVSQRELP